MTSWTWDQVRERLEEVYTRPMGTDGHGRRMLALVGCLSRVPDLPVPVVSLGSLAYNQAGPGLIVEVGVAVSSGAADQYRVSLLDWERERYVMTTELGLEGVPTRVRAALEEARRS